MFRIKFRLSLFAFFSGLTTGALYTIRISTHLLSAAATDTCYLYANEARSIQVHGHMTYRRDLTCLGLQIHQSLWKCLVMIVFISTKTDIKNVWNARKRKKMKLFFLNWCHYDKWIWTQFYRKIFLGILVCLFIFFFFFDSIFCLLVYLDNHYAHG